MFLSLKEITYKFYCQYHHTSMTEKQYQLQQKNFIEILRAFGIDPNWIKVDGVYSIPSKYEEFILGVLACYKDPWVKEVRAGNITDCNLERVKACHDLFLAIVQETSKDDEEFQIRAEESEFFTHIDLLTKRQQSRRGLSEAAYAIANYTDEHFDTFIGNDEELLLNNYILCKLKLLEQEICGIWDEMSTICLDEFKKDFEALLTDNEAEEIYADRLLLIQRKLKNDPEYCAIEEEIFSLIRRDKYLGSRRLDFLEARKESLIKKAEAEIFGFIMQPPPSKPERIRLTPEKIFSLSIERYTNRKNGESKA